jgi:thioester reductase-like protein
MTSAESEVAEFFRGRSVLVTGASGFMGKVLLEKLLYSCPDLRAIYILLRTKRHKTPEARTEEMLKIPVKILIDWFSARRSAMLTDGHRGPSLSIQANAGILS